MSSPNTKDAVYTDNIYKGFPLEIREIGTQCHIPEAALDHFYRVSSFTYDPVTKHHDVPKEGTDYSVKHPVVLKNQVMEFIKAAVQIYIGNSQKNKDDLVSQARWEEAREIFLYDQGKRGSETRKAITGPLFDAAVREGVDRVDSEAEVSAPSEVDF